MNRPFSVTSPTHGKALFFTWLEVLFGAFIAIGVVPTPSFDVAFTVVGTRALGLAMFVGAGFQLYASYRQGKTNDLQWMMKLELIALLWSICIYFSFLSATVFYSGFKTIAGAFFIIALIGGSIQRAVQVRKDLRRLLDATACPRWADEITLADPEKDAATQS